MRLTVVLVCLLALGICAVARAAEEAAASPFVLSADVVEWDLRGETAEATGSATLTHGDAALKADHITANRTTGEVRASGHLVLTKAGRSLSGDVLEYNTEREEGAITNARAQEQGVILQGDRIEFSPRQLVAHHAVFTTCDLPEPDYAFISERITLTATQTDPKGRPIGGRVKLSRPRLMFHGRTLLKLPSYSRSVGQLQERGIPFLPVLGVSRLDGPFAAFGNTYGPEEGLAVDTEWRLTSRRGARGFAEVHRPVGPTAAYVRYSDREDVSEGDTIADEITRDFSGVLVDRKPEVGVRLGERQLGRRWHLEAAASWGDYLEVDPDDDQYRVEDSRLSVLALVGSRPHPISRRVSLSYDLGYRHSAYSAGDRLRVLYGRVGARYAITPENWFDLSYAHRGTSGETPFQFDAVQVRDELRAEVQYRVSSRWRVRLMDLYDLEENRSRDAHIAVTRVAHCLEYTAGWKKLHNSFFVGIGLAGRPGTAGGNTGTAATRFRP